MSFSTDPPDPAEFPRRRLLLPAALLAVIFGLAWLGDRAGLQTLNIHGPGVVVMLVLPVLFFVGVIKSGLSLVLVVPALWQHPSLRSPSNLACTSVSALFVAYFAFGLAIAIWQ
jgi:hypothetical protein